MAFKLVKRNKLRVTVKGSVAGEDGKPSKFEFVLVCHRLTQSEIDAVIADKELLTVEVLRRVVFDWEGIIDEEGEPIPFSSSSLDECLLEQPGMRSVCYQAYLKDIAAVAKN